MQRFYSQKLKSFAVEFANGFVFQKRTHFWGSIKGGWAVKTVLWRGMNPKLLHQRRPYPLHQKAHWCGVGCGETSSIRIAQPVLLVSLSNQDIAPDENCLATSLIICYDSPSGISLIAEGDDR
jgi:hypothetical protein